MIINNVKVYTEEGIFEEGSVYIKGGRFVSPSVYYERKAAGEENRKRSLTEKDVMRFRGLSTCIFMGVWARISATEPKRR